MHLHHLEDKQPQRSSTGSVARRAIRRCPWHAGQARFGGINAEANPTANGIMSNVPRIRPTPPCTGSTGETRLCRAVLACAVCMRQLGQHRRAAPVLRTCASDMSTLRSVGGPLCGSAAGNQARLDLQGLTAAALPLW